MIGIPPNRERFLAAIAERVSPDRVQALYLFPAIRQGPVETGIAVLAVDPVAADVVALPGSQLLAEDAEAPLVESAQPESAPSLAARPLILTARYRHTLKGADRGKWELEILEQADASLVTLEKVIQGVLRRLDDNTEPERLGADALRAALADGVWTTPQR